MEQKTDEKYSYLSQKTKESLLRMYRLCNVNDTDWADYTMEGFCTLAKEQGFEVEPENCSYTGFWSQGDGASFVCDIDLKPYQEEYGLSDRLLASGMSAHAIRRSRVRGAHEGTCKVEIVLWGVELGDFTDYPEALGQRLQELEEVLELQRLTLSKKLFSMLEVAYTHNISDAAVWATIEAADYFGWEPVREPAYSRVHRAITGAGESYDPRVVASAWQELQKSLVGLVAGGFGGYTIEELLSAIGTLPHAQGERPCLTGPESEHIFYGNGHRASRDQVVDLEP